MDTNDFGADYLTIEDENGDLFDLEVLDTFELSGQEYLAALPADMEEDDPDYGIILLRIVEEDGFEVYESIDDDDELQTVYEAFIRMLEEDEEEN